MASLVMTTSSNSICTSSHEKTEQQPQQHQQQHQQLVGPSNENNNNNNNNSSSSTLLAQQYGGRHVGGWVDRLPACVIPYVQLSRLSPPAALLLILFPHFFGILHAAIVLLSSSSSSSSSSSIETAVALVPAMLRACAIVVAGCFFASNAAHAWNDLIDAPLDRLVARTRDRPVARGAISPRAAFLFAASQALLAALLLRAAGPGTDHHPWLRLLRKVPLRLAALGLESVTF
ncbi:hypothetical protein VTH06DRAFT_293 [Thermothelomyces fergusii]